MSKPMFGDPVESAKFYVHSIVSMYTDNEDFYRAAFMVGNQEGIFDDRKSTPHKASPYTQIHGCP
jgi:hypothetical protein